MSFWRGRPSQGTQRGDIILGTIPSATGSGFLLLSGPARGRYQSHEGSKYRSGLRVSLVVNLVFLRQELVWSL